MAKGFGMKLVGYDPYLPKEVADQFGIELMSIERLAEVSDVVLSHVPLMPSTEKMVAGNLFHNLKKSPVFVNTSRGGTVDYDLLCDCPGGRPCPLRRSGRGGFRARRLQYPHLPAEERHLHAHAAFYSETALEEVRRRSAENVVNYLTGHPEKVNFVVKPE